MVEVLALIPARGGSKGIRRKNICKVAGKPLIAYSIEDALATPLITRVIVSTDDDEIAEVARQFGAEVPFMRPLQLAQDHSTDWEVFNHALRWLLGEENYVPELVVHLRPTSPIRRPEKLNEAIRLMLDHPEADSLRSVHPPEQTPYKMWHIVDGRLRPLLYVQGIAEPFNMPRQSLPKVYYQNGYVDITRPCVVLERGLMNGDNIMPFLIEEKLADIDYEESIQEAEALIEWRQAHPGKVLYADRRHPA